MKDMTKEDLEEIKNHAAELDRIEEYWRNRGFLDNIPKVSALKVAILLNNQSLYAKKHHSNTTFGRCCVAMSFRIINRFVKESIPFAVTNVLYDGHSKIKPVMLKSRFITQHIVQNIQNIDGIIDDTFNQIVGNLKPRQGVFFKTLFTLESRKYARLHSEFEYV